MIRQPIQKTEVSCVFTIIFAEEKVIQSVKEYSLFFKPFTDVDNFTFCRWNTDGETLDEIVPDFYEKIGNKQEWRAIVIIPDKEKESRNPFDFVNLELPIRKAGESTVDYHKRKKEKVIEGYEKAVNNPLTKLTTYLSYENEEKKKEYDDFQYKNLKENLVIDNANSEFLTYAQESSKRIDCINSILKNGTLRVSLPCEVIAVSLRNFDSDKVNLTKSWETHDEAEYTDFAKYNMYHSKVRFLLYDILSQGHRQYEFDHIKFLLSVITIAQNPVPSDTLKEGRVYKLNCEIDNNTLSELMILYRCKLNATVKKLKKEIAGINKAPTKYLHDNEVENLFMKNVRVNLEVNRDFETKKLYCSSKKIGLSRDCPAEESSVWKARYFESRKALHKFLKEPRRSLKRATKDFRYLTMVSEEKAHLLNEFQIEDICEYINDAETRMHTIETINVYDTESYTNRVEARSDDVKEKIETRMTRKSTVIAGLISIGVFFLCLAPMLYSNAKDYGTFIFSLVFSLVATGVVSLVGFITLFFLRRGLTKKFDSYNSEMNGITKEIYNGMERYSDYLTEMCKVMRGNSVINYVKETDDAGRLSVRVLKKHLADVNNIISDCEFVFSEILEDVDYSRYKDIEPYDYNFSKITDYEFPLPFDNFKNGKTMYFIYGNDIVLPVNYIKSITVQREDWYE